MSEVMGMSIEDAARAAGCSRTTLFTLIREGRGPDTYRLGRRRLVSRDALQRWIRELEAEEGNGSDGDS